MKRALLPLLVFLVALGGLGLSSWNYLAGPSRHFHFIDLAESILQGRLDTDTPHRRKAGPVLPGDPPGLQEAVDRQLTGPGGGWNDWVAYHEVTLESGERFKGVWPWKNRGKGKPGYDRRDTFVTLEGAWVTFHKVRDVLGLCLDRPLDPSPEVQDAWRDRDQHPAARAACAAPPADPPACCGPDQTRVTCTQKRHFVSFPPGPALVLLPFVAVWHYRVNDVLFTLAFGAGAAVLLFLLLAALARRGYSALGVRERLVLVGLFIFGTVFHFSAIRGEVWYTALVLGVFFHLGYLLCALDLRHPLLAGLFLALGFATRTSLLFTSSFFVLQLLLSRQGWDRDGLLARLRKATWFALPTVAAGLVLMLYNHARFGSPFEFGHRFLMDGTRTSIVDHGLFHPWFLPDNLAAAFANVPRFSGTWPYVKISGHGLSLLFTTPVLLYLLWPRRGDPGAEGLDRYRWSMRRILWVTTAATAIPGLLYQNTGWFQFAYRFGLDWMPLLFALLAMDRRPRGWLFYSLVVFAVAVNTFGAVTFQRFPVFYD
ncbi:MAG: hypothetical protein FJ098_02155 [Deltaproteobacteria bacterium]|nr:hypothetical protein [Deltaproteobacteria bacterium]